MDVSEVSLRPFGGVARGLARCAGPAGYWYRVRVRFLSASPGARSEEQAEKGSDGMPQAGMSAY